MSQGSQFVGGPLDGEVRAIKDDPPTYCVMEMPLPVFRPDGAWSKPIKHVYEKRAGGFYYEYVPDAS